MKLNNIIVVLLILTVTINIQSQNLVLNPSFENVSDSHHIQGSYDMECIPWKVGLGSTVDYFSSNNDSISQTGVPKNWTGTYYPHTGSSYIGLFLISTKNTSMENIIGEFSTPLIRGKRYEVSLYVQMAYSISDFSSNAIGAYISKENLFKNKLAGLFYYKSISKKIKATIQSSEYIKDTGWVEIKGTYIAQGGEKYITIGMFWHEDIKMDKLASVIDREQGVNFSHTKKLCSLIQKKTMKKNKMKYIDTREHFKCPYYLIDDVSVIELKK